MGCNCKKDKINGVSEGEISNIPTGQIIISYIFKTLAFLLFLVALPIINIIIIGFVFKTLILNKEVNIKPLLMAIGQKFQINYEDDDDDDDDVNEWNEDEVEMEDVEDITKVSK